MTSITLGNHTIELSPPRDAYRAIRLKYIRLAEITKQNFLSRYSAMFKQKLLIQDILNGVSIEYLEYISDISVRDLVDHEIFDIDDSMLLEEYAKGHSTWGREIEGICDEYMQILMDRDAYKQYLDYKRQASSSSIVGGGFGIEGAVAGVVTAGVANAVLGTVTGAMSAASEKLKTMETNIRLEQLINSEKTKFVLADAVYRLVFNIHYTLVDVISEYRGSNIFDPISKKDERKVGAIAQNIMRGRIAGNHIPRALLDGISLNPFNSQIYELWNHHVSSLESEFSKLSESFGLIRIESAKTETIDEFQPPPQTQSDHASLINGALNIINNYTSKDLFINNNISENKRKNAREKYFKSSSDIMLALIDSTLFGSANEGLAIGLEGIYWKDVGKEPNFIGWEALASGSIKLKKSFMSVKIGESGFTPGSDMSKDSIVALLKNLAGYFEHRQKT